MSAIPARVCAQCGATFTPTRVMARFCSLRCKHAWWSDRCRERRQAQPLEPRKCAFCGAAFSPHDARQRFCSPRCQRSAWKHAHGDCVAAYRERRRAHFKPRACLYCGQTFTPTYHDAARFCSASCRRAYQYRQRTSPGAIAGARRTGVDRAKVEAYLLLPDDERYARRNELNQAERSLAARLFNERNARDMSCWHQCWGV